ncbi:MAG: BPL-N domain-containing protein [Thermoleophilia bacterium]|nr:BPL-N domain-containing protein [Thermoleophilia bacterium]
MIAYETFRKLGVSFDLITSEEIRAEVLDDYDLLFVPGGWASDKIAALGDEGRERIRDYVKAGGSYLGICGGAGLALSHESGLGLAPVSRMPTRSRVPSFSGSIELEPVEPEHPMWKGFPAGGVFHAWWPGQFSLDEAAEVRVLARYGSPRPDSFVTDLPVIDEMDWERWEERYSINLNPERIVGEPAVIETSFGSGTVLLSYLHFETPGDRDGHAVLLNILEYLSGGDIIRPRPEAGDLPVERDGISIDAISQSAELDNAEAAYDLAAENEKDKAAYELAAELLESIESLVTFGKNNFLWYERNDWILQWRRGVRGVEYSTLHAMFGKLYSCLSRIEPVDRVMVAELRRLLKITRHFTQDALKLLTLERNAISRGPLSPLKTGDKQIRELRDELFSSSKRCGGRYEEVINLLDGILLRLLRRELRE